MPEFGVPHTPRSSAASFHEFQLSSCLSLRKHRSPQDQQVGRRYPLQDMRRPECEGSLIWRRLHPTVSVKRLSKTSAWRTQPAVVPSHTTVQPTYPRVSVGHCPHSAQLWKVGRWHVRRSARWRGVESGGARARHCQVLAFPQSHRPLCCARSHQGCPPHDFRACRSSHCQVLAFPLTHSPEGGSQWCQITPGVANPTTSGRMWMYL